MASEQSDNQTQPSQEGQNNHYVFFQSWALWQKMTFVLMIAIVLVCFAGFLKLRWRTRLEQKLELRDEEKATTLRESKTNAPMTEIKVASDIPFGIRALESGIEVDGIWVSRSGTPLPESLRRFRHRERKSTTSFESKDSCRTIHSQQTSRSSPTSLEDSPLSRRNSEYTAPVIIPPDMFLEPGHSGSTGSSFRSSQMTDDREPSFISSNAVNLSKSGGIGYKPRRSSQLRFSSYGESQCHQETLAQLEGKPPKNKTDHSRLSLGSDIRVDMEFSSEVGIADNELISGSSSDSDSKVSVKRLAKDVNFQLQARYSAREADIKDKNRTGYGRQTSSDTVTPKVLSGTFSIQPYPPPRSWLNSFVTPETSPAQANMNLSASSRPKLHDEDISNEVRWPLLSSNIPESPEPPPFRSSQIRVNKSVRKVNSGFEILPAGTFGTIPAYIDGVVAGDISPDIHSNRTSKKLQKKGFGSGS